MENNSCYKCANFLHINSLCAEDYCMVAHSVDKRFKDGADIYNLRRLHPECKMFESAYKHIEIIKSTDEKNVP